MKRIFISVPMTDRSEDEILLSASVAWLRYMMCHTDFSRPDEIENFVKNNVPVMNYILPEDVSKKAEKSKRPNLVLLGHAIQLMADCDDVVFAEDFEEARGCKIESLVYDLYFNGES